MYMPRQFEETRPQVLQSLMKSHPLSTLVVVAAVGAVAAGLRLVPDLRSRPRWLGRPDGARRPA